jgi:hypothetical protein
MCYPLLPLHLRGGRGGPCRCGVEVGWVGRNAVSSALQGCVWGAVWRVAAERVRVMGGNR